MQKQLFMLVLAASLPFVCQAQTQTLKGKIVDKAVRSELIGATVQIQPTNKPGEAVRGTAANENGDFRFEKLPLGKYTVLISYLGYKNAVLPNVVVDAGKETELLVELEEQVLTGAEVVIAANIEKEKPLNELSTVSTRTFSVDETRRFAAAVNDPARMATSYAGVVAAYDGNNHIIVRGNAPNGLLWRMEGVEIPNPNHFSSIGTSGGGISIISAQLLSNSDFSTGAFAAEYGNATSGVFDLRLRKGNTDRREFTVQAGILGTDLAAEGPVGSGSYLVNYRYSTLSLLDKLGVPLGDEAIDFQDLSFNVWMPAGRFGNFSLFGLGGLSTSQMPGKTDSAAWRENFNQKYPFVFRANTGVAGLTHNKTWGSNTWLKTVVAASKTENSFELDQFLLPDYQLRREQENNSEQQKLTVSSVLSHKFSARHYLRTGFYANFLGFDLSQHELDPEQEQLVEQIRRQGETQTLQAFAQWQYRPTDRLTFNAGLHALTLRLNNTTSLEPRLALKYSPDARQSFSFGYGLHGQTQVLTAYFVKNEAGELLNPNLDLLKSHHFVAGYDRQLRKNLRFKTEVYLQNLFDVAVSRGEATSYSVLNEFDNAPPLALENTGLARNYGLELTLEQFLSRGFYFLLSSSWFNSEYRASDLVWRSTKFNTRHANTLTAGKEWDWNRRGKNRTFGLNLKIVSTGGLHETPVDLEASKKAERTVFDESQAFSEQLPAYFRADVGLKLKRNYRHLTTTLSLDIQNVTNRKNIGGRYYDPSDFSVKYYHQAPLIPILAYRLEF